MLLLQYLDEINTSHGFASHAAAAFPLITWQRNLSCRSFIMNQKCFPQLCKSDPLHFRVKTCSCYTNSNSSLLFLQQQHNNILHNLCEFMWNSTEHFREMVNYWYKLTEIHTAAQKTQLLMSMQQTDRFNLFNTAITSMNQSLQTWFKI